jgi:hypothetical protein
VSGVGTGRRSLRLLLLVGGLLLLLVAGAGYATVRTGTPALRATGPTRVTGTEASAVFSIADRRIRQVRYRDRGVLDYRFRLTNAERLPIKVRLAARQQGSRLFRIVGLEGPGGSGAVTLPGHGSRSVHLRLRMGGCESLSARAGSFASSVLLRTERLGIAVGVVRVQLPEEIHTGSPREAFCPNSTADSRSPG